MKSPLLRRPPLRPLFLLALAALLSACAGNRSTPSDGAAIPADAQAAGFLIERSELRYTAEAAWQSVRIINPHGDLRIRRGVAGRLGLSVAAQRLAPEWQSPRIDRDEAAGHLTLTVRYDAPAPGAVARFGRIGRVDLVAFVPEDVVLVAETDDGALLIRHRQGPIQARSRAGRIHASSGSALTVENDSGPTLARLAGAGPLQASTLRSGKGNIDLLLPRRAAYVLEVEAAGGVTAGPGWYPADGFVPPPGATRLTHRNGSDGASIRVRSSAGPVSIGAVAELPEGGLPPEPED